MRHYSKTIAIYAILILSLLALPLSGCKTNTDTANRIMTPPQIPPKSSFVMDVSDFLDASNASINQENEDGRVRLVSFRQPVDNSLNLPNALGDRSNWTFAAFNVGFWNIVGLLGLAIPVASFVESFNHTPVQQSDYTWVWQYSVTVADVQYTAELHGKYIDNGVRWEMYVTKPNEYTDFLWYYGESDLPATEGYWVLKNKPADPTDLLRIDWSRDLAEGTFDIKYMNIVPGGAENGGFISCAVTNGKTYDRSYEIFNKGKAQTTLIEWNSTTNEGRVRDTTHFKDDDWHYWDTQLKNAASAT